MISKVKKRGVIEIITSIILSTSLIIQLLIPIIANYPQSRRLLLTYDPSYAYLLNAGNILIGKPIYHVDHPGTPVQLLFALVILICFLPFTFQKSIPTFIVEYSDQLIAIYQIFFLSISALFLLIAYKLIKRKSNSLSAIMFSFSFIFAFGTYANISYWTSATPDSMAIILSSLILLVTFVAHLSKKTKLHLLGILLSTILMTKLNTIPFLIIILIACQNRSDFYKFLKSFVLTSAFWMILIHQNFIRFVKWSVNLFVNSGAHGSNDSFLNFNEIFRSLSSTKTILIPLLILVVVIGRNLIIEKKNFRNIIRQTEVLLYVILLLGYFSVLRTGVFHYFLPFWPIVGFLYANYFSLFWRSSHEKSAQLISNEYKKKSTYKYELSKFDFAIISTLSTYLVLLLSDNTQYFGILYSIYFFSFMIPLIYASNVIKGKFPLRKIDKKVMMMPVFFILVLVFLVLPLFNEIKILNQSRLLEISNNILIQELESDSIVLIGDNTPTKSAALKHGNGFAGGTFTREIESISNHAVYLQEISGEFANIRNFNLVDSANNKVTCNSRNLRAPNSVIIFLTRNPLGSQSYSQLDEIRINETTFSDLSSVSDLGDYRVIRLSDFSCT